MLEQCFVHSNLLPEQTPRTYLCTEIKVGISKTEVHKSWISLLGQKHSFVFCLKVCKLWLCGSPGQQYNFAYPFRPRYLLITSSTYCSLSVKTYPFYIWSK